MGVLLLGGSALALPDLPSGAGDAWRWLARTESFQAGVGESLPLFGEARRFGVGLAVSRLSWFVLLFPVALLVALGWAWSRPNRPALLLWLGWSAGLFAATLLQRRFFNSFSVAMALVMGWSVCQAYPPPCRQRAVALGHSAAHPILVREATQPRRDGALVGPQD
jgi:asparagine N-glycosylation enzyme membrane subunit Stt3